MQETDAGITSLEQLLACESLAMAKYAHSNGKTIPDGVTEALNDILVKRGYHLPGALDCNTEAVQAPTTPSEITTASRHSVRRLACIHTRLAQAVAPATPGAIRYLTENAEKKHFLGFLGPVDLVKRMMLMSALFLVLFMFASQTPYVTPKIIASNEIFDKTGIELIMIMLFYMSAAGIGACFAGLYQANRYIAEGTFDPKFEPSYWSRLALGIIAGLIISILVPLDASIGKDQNAHDIAAWVMLAKPTLAMLGGFSSALVYRVLNRLVEAVESLVRTEMRQELSQHKKVLDSQHEELVTQSRMEMAARLVKLQQNLVKGDGTEQMTQQLEVMLNDLFPAELSSMDADEDASRD